MKDFKFSLSKTRYRIGILLLITVMMLPMGMATSKTVANNAVMVKTIKQKISLFQTLIQIKSKSELHHSDMNLQNLMVY